MHVVGRKALGLRPPHFGIEMPDRRPGSRAGWGISRRGESVTGYQRNPEPAGLGQLHSRTVMSPLAVASRRPSGLNATALT